MDEIRRQKAPLPKASSLGGRGEAERAALDRAFPQALGKRRVEALADVLRQRYRFRVAEDLDCLPRRIHYQTAIFTVFEVPLEISADSRVNLAVQVIRKFADYSPAVHFDSLRPKKLFSLWRNFRRARSKRVFVAGTEMPINCAASSVEIPSTSRRTKMVR